jgi:hypothetical protein
MVTFDIVQDAVRRWNVAYQRQSLLGFGQNLRRGAPAGDTLNNITTFDESCELGYKNPAPTGYLLRTRNSEEKKRHIVIERL